VEDVGNINLVVFIEDCLHGAVVDRTIHDAAKDDSSVTACTSDGCAISRPGESQNRTAFGLVETVGPASLVAKTEHFEGTDCEVFTIWLPFDTCHDVVVGQGRVELSSVLVPNSVLAVFTT